MPKHHMTAQPTFVRVGYNDEGELDLDEDGNILQWYGAGDLMDALGNAAVCFENLADARTLLSQADAMVDLSNAMSDLASYHPSYDIKQGRVVPKDEGGDA